MPGLFALLFLLAFAAIPLLIVLLVVWLTRRERTRMVPPRYAPPPAPDKVAAALLLLASVLATLLIVPGLLAEVASGRIVWPVRALGRSIEVTAAGQPLAFALSAALYLMMCGLCLSVCLTLYRDWRR